MPAAESLESRIVPVVSFSFAGSTLTLNGPAGPALLVVEGGLSTKIYEGGVFVGEITSATNDNIDTITVQGAGVAASLTVVGNNSTLTTINLTDTPILSLNHGVNVDVTSTTVAGVQFGSTTITGDLEVDAVGPITQVAGTTLTVVGTADIDVTGFAITLANNNAAGVPVNGFGTLVLDGTAISIREGNPTNLGIVNATGALTVFSTGGVTGAAEINVGGVTSINTGKGGDINLTSVDNTFTTLNLSGANITVVEDNATGIDLGTVTASGNLDVTSEGAGNSITTSGNLTVGLLGTFTTAGAVVDLSGATDNLGSISVIAAAAAVTIDEDSATNLDTITAASLSVTSAGAITDFRAASSVTVTGATTLLAGANAITLSNVTNDFQGTVRFVGSNVTLVDGAEGVELGSLVGASTATTLTVTATRAAGAAVAPIIDTAGAMVTVAGKADINAIGSGPLDFQAITLDDGTWGGLALRGSTAVITEAGGTDLFNCTITGATFTVTATTGNITNGVAPLPGGKQGYHNISAGAAAVSFITVAAGADITILNAAQVISTFGTLTVTTNAAAGSDASISEGFGTVLAGVSVGGDFTLNAIDGIPTPPTTVLRSVTQTGVIDVGEVTTINASPSFEVVLTTAGNDFGTGLGVTGRNVTIDDDDATGVALDLSTIAGNFSLNSAGPITQAATGTFGRLKVVGTATLVTTSSIVLDRRDPVSTAPGAPFENASNTMGTLFLTATGSGAAGTVTIIEKGNTTLGTSAVGVAAGADELFTIVSTGSITDVGVITALGEDTTMTSIAYATSVAAPALGALLAAAPAGTIALDSDDGAFVPAPTNVFVGEINLRGTNVVLKDTGSTELGAILATGTLTVTSTGSVDNPTELVSVGGLAKFIKSGAVAADLTLGTTARSLLGSLSAVGQTPAVSFTNVSLREGNSTSLGAMTVSGNLVIDSTDAVTDTGTITVTGTTSITTSGDDIILDSVANNFVGDFTFIGAGSVSLVDSAGGIEFGLVSTGTTLTVKATGGDVTDDAAATLTIGGGTGAVNINAISNDILLNNVTNTYGILTLKGATADIAEAAGSTPLTLGNTSLSGTLNLVAGGAVTQPAGSSVIAGNTTIQAATSVTLTNVNPTNTGNRLGTLIIGPTTQLTGTISIVENDAIVLGEIDVADALSLTANGTITQVADQITAGATTLTAVGKDITLNAAGNSFTSLAVTAQNVSITEDNDALAGTAIGGTVEGSLTLTAAGAVTNNGALLVSGSATIASPSTVTLSNVANQFGSISVTGATTVTIVESGNTVLGIVTPSAALNVTSTGNITDTGVDATSLITVAGGTATLSAGGSITLDDDDNNFSTVDFAGVNVTLNDSVGTIVFTASEATGNLTVTAVGDVTQTGLLNIDGRTSVATTGAGIIDLDTAGNLFGGTVSLRTGTGTIDLLDLDGALDLGATSTTGALTVSATGGAVTQSGAINVGNTIITANTVGGSAITLTNINNTFGTLDLTSNSNIAILDKSIINVAAAGIQTGAGGTLLLRSTLAAGTAIVQAAGGVITAGNTTLIADGVNRNITLTEAANVFGTLSITGNTATIEETDGASGTDLGTITLTGNLIVDSNSEDIDDVGTLHVAGTLDLTATGNNILLNDANSTFGPLNLEGVNITVTDSGAVDLADIDATGTFALIYGGAVTDSGAVTVTGTTTITPQSLPGNQQITLNSGADLTGAVAMTGSSILLTNTAATGTTLGFVAANGTLTVTSTGAAGDIVGNGASVVATGLATFTAVAGQDIDFDLSATNFTIVRFVGQDAILSAESDNLDLDTSTLTGSLTITTVPGLVEPGSITDSGTLTIGGTVNLDVSNGANPSTATIILDQPLSTFGTNVIATADLILNSDSTIFVKDNGIVVLGDVTAGGSLTIISGLGALDNILQTAASSVQTDSAAFSALFNAGAGIVDLSNAGTNDFVGPFSWIGAGPGVQE